MTWEEACDLEIKMIAFYGRRDKKQGCLVNLTDGGDGTKGWVPSEKTKQKIRKKAIGRKQSDVTKQKRIQKLTGKKRSEEIKQKSIGGNNSRAKKIICNVTGKIYLCIKDAAEDNELCYTALISSLNGKRSNKTSLKYLIDSK